MTIKHYDLVSLFQAPRWEKNECHDTLCFHTLNPDGWRGGGGQDLTVLVTKI